MAGAATESLSSPAFGRSDTRAFSMATPTCQNIQARLTVVDRAHEPVDGLAQLRELR